VNAKSVKNTVTPSVGAPVVKGLCAAMGICR
jgi:hypothetical protein